MPYSKMPLVGTSGRPFLIGSGMTPGAPEMGWPPPSYIRDMLIARRAPFGQNGVLSVMIASFPSAIALKVPAALAPAAARNSRRFTVGLQDVVDSAQKNNRCVERRFVCRGDAC